MDATTKFILRLSYPALALDDWVTINGTHVETDENGQLRGDVGQKIQRAKIDAQVRALRESGNRVDSRNPLDHGQLNTPIEKRGLNSQINAWKKEDAKQRKEARKESHQKTQDRFAQEREAKNILKEHKKSLINYFVNHSWGYLNISGFSFVSLVYFNNETSENGFSSP